MVLKADVPRGTASKVHEAPLLVLVAIIPELDPSGGVASPTMKQ
jgi:hypothetical protein